MRTPFTTDEEALVIGASVGSCTLETTADGAPEAIARTTPSTLRVESAYGQGRVMSRSFFDSLEEVSTGPDFATYFIFFLIKGSIPAAIN